MKRCIPIGLALFIIGCASPRYLFIDSEILQSKIDETGKIPVRRYVLSPENYPDNGLAFIHVEPAKSYLAVLKKNNPKKAARFIQCDAFTRTADSTVKSFCYALYYFVASEYDSCLNQINRLNDNVKTCFIRFIMVDCDFETTWSWGNAAFDEFVEKYQKVLDCNQNELNEEIIKNRIKLMRYGY
jgi:hypothetical protein